MERKIAFWCGLHCADKGFLETYRAKPQSLFTKMAPKGPGAGMKVEVEEEGEKA